MRILVVDHEFRSRWAIADWLAVFLDAVAVESRLVAFLQQRFSLRLTALRPGLLSKS